MASSNTIPSFQTLSRDELRSLRARHYEKKRLDKIDKIIKNICRKVYERARFTKKTYLICPIETNKESPIYKFVMDNMADILSRLQSRFPDSSIQLKTVAWGVTNNRQFYDTSKISKTQRKYIYVATSECILINW